MEQAKRFRGMLADLGIKHPEAAKMLHISLRTLQNWLSGRHQVPYSVYKLLRMMRYMELPGQSWRGWHFSRGQLVTPEGRTISGNDGSWWSLLVRKSNSFGQLYRELQLERLAQTQAGQAVGFGAVGAVPDAGLVSVSTTPTEPPNTWGQNDPIMESWPTISDFPPLSTLTPDSAVSASESASTPCYALPWMPTFAPVQSQPAQALNPETVPAKPGLSLPLLADSWLNRAYLPHRLHLPKAPSPSCPRISAGKLPGVSASPEKANTELNPELVGGAA